jgi:hypothetical protein
MNNPSDPSRAYRRPVEVANIFNDGSSAQPNTLTTTDSSKTTINQGEKLENSATQLMGALQEDAKNCACTPLFMAFYDNKNKEFLVKNSRGIWIRQVDSQMSLHLRNANFRIEKSKNESLSPFEREKLRIIKEHGVEYAGPLAGYREGFYKEKSWLITQSPNLLSPKCGDWSTLKLVLEAIFADDYPQLDYIYGWLKVSLGALYAGQSFPRQALVFAGERGCGKSFF